MQATTSSIRRVFLVICLATFSLLLIEIIGLVCFGTPSVYESNLRDKISVAVAKFPEWFLSLKIVLWMAIQFFGMLHITRHERPFQGIVFFWNGLTMWSHLYRQPYPIWFFIVVAFVFFMASYSAHKIGLRVAPRNALSADA